MTTNKIIVGTCNYLMFNHGEDPSSKIIIGDIDKDGIIHNLVSKNIGPNNPSFICLSTDRKYLYTTNEIKDGSILSFEMRDFDTEPIKPILVRSSHGDHPCHLSLDSEGEYIFCANYTSGSIIVYPVDKSESTHFVKHSGPVSEAHFDRQEGSHCHMIRQHPNLKEYIFVADLGLDRLYAYQFDAKKGMLSEGKYFQFPLGNGPRHFDFHPTRPFVYVLQELTGNVYVLDLNLIDKGDLNISEVEKIPTITDGECSRAHHAGSSDIHLSIDGKFLYLLNRSNCTISSYSVNIDTGKLTFAERVPTLGKVPRNFCLVEVENNSLLIIANEESKLLVTYHRDTNTGRLSNAKQFEVNSWPTCIIPFKN